MVLVSNEGEVQVLSKRVIHCIENEYRFGGKDTQEFLDSIGSLEGDFFA